MDYKYLVDVNLPKYFKFFNEDCFIHVVDINPHLTDTAIWEYALENNLVIITKDSDFYVKSILSVKYPKIIYLQIGNQTLKELNVYFEKNWDKIIASLDNARLVIAKLDSISVF